MTITTTCYYRNHKGKLDYIDVEDTDDITLDEAHYSGVVEFVKANLSAVQPFKTAVMAKVK